MFDRCNDSNFFFLFVWLDMHGWFHNESYYIFAEHIIVISLPLYLISRTLIYEINYRLTKKDELHVLYCIFLIFLIITSTGFLKYLWQYLLHKEKVPLAWTLIIFCYKLLEKYENFKNFYCRSPPISSCLIIFDLIILGIYITHTSLWLTYHYMVNEIMKNVNKLPEWKIDIWVSRAFS